MASALMTKRKKSENSRRRISSNDNNNNINDAYDEANQGDSGSNDVEDRIQTERQSSNCKVCFNHQN